jgi:hypothetical protein
VQQTVKNSSSLKLVGLAVLGLVIGLAIGLAIGWAIWAGLAEATFADLQTSDKEDYIVLVAEAYAYDGDLEKAQTRLAALEAPNIEMWVVDLTERSIAGEGEEAETQALAGLAYGLGAHTEQMVAYVASPTPRPTNTPPPTATPLPTDTPTVTPVPPTETPVPPTDTPPPTATPAPPTETPAPSATPVPPTDTPPPTSPPQPTNTPKPPPTPTNTPKPAGPKWNPDVWLVGPGQDGQGCDYGNLQIRVTVVDANNNQIPGVWIHDRYSGQYQVTGNVDSPDWGIGETKFEYGIGGGGSLCVADGEGGGCQSDYTRDMPAYAAPSVEDLHGAGYCDQCCEPGATLERCRDLVNQGKCMGFGHYSWRVVFRRSH